MAVGFAKPISAVTAACFSLISVGVETKFCVWHNKALCRVVSFVSLFVSFFAKTGKTGGSTARIMFRCVSCNVQITSQFKHAFQ
jgi:hypothetical protein